MNDARTIETKKWIKVIYLSGGQYSISKNIRLKTPILRSVLCYYSDVYIVIKGKVTVICTVVAKERNKCWFLSIILCLNHAYQKSITH